MKADKQSKKELLILLEDMDIPIYRKKIDSNYDTNWLNKNLSIRNSEHKNFSKAMSLIEKML